MTEVLVALIAFLAGMAVEWMRTRGRIRELETANQRKDHEHRQSYYHQLLSAAEDLVADARDDPGEEPPVDLGSQGLDAWSYEFQEHAKEKERHLGSFRTALVAVDTFGSRRVMECANAFLGAVDSGCGPDELESKREALVEAARADVAPD